MAVPHGSLHRQFAVDRFPDPFGSYAELGMIVPGTSLGDVHTLLLYPQMASHRNLSPKMRERLGIRENLVRVAVGIEHIDDIRADLDQALAAIA